MKRRILIPSAIMITVLLRILIAEAKTAPPGNFEEFQVKAAFLYNFARFVEWPDEKFTNIVIGILGDDPFGSSIDQLIEEKNIRGKQLSVRRFKSISELESCHILYVSESMSAKLEDIIQFAQSRSILTVSDINGFAEAGGTIQLDLVENKVRFQVNLDSAQNSHLTMSSNLLKLAKNVKSSDLKEEK